MSTTITSANRTSADNQAPAAHAKSFTITILALWFLAALIASLAGAFDSASKPPIPLGAAALLPVLLVGLLYSVWPAFRQFVLSASPRSLTLAQTWRVGGLIFVILYAKGLLPASFALPAGWGDFAIGITAPLVAFTLLPSTARSRPLLYTWHILGITDLVSAVTLGVLSSAGPVGILATDVTTRLMGQFPLSLIPTFFVPLLLILHLIALGQLRQAGAQRHEPQA